LCLLDDAAILQPAAIHLLEPNMDSEYGHRWHMVATQVGSQRIPVNLQAQREADHKPNHGQNLGREVDGLRLGADGLFQSQVQPATAMLAERSEAIFTSWPIWTTEGLLSVIRDRLTAVQPGRGGLFMATGRGSTVLPHRPADGRGARTLRGDGTP
jgi:hypothetical protein